MSNDIIACKLKELDSFDLYSLFNGILILLGYLILDGWLVGSYGISTFEG